MSNWAKTMVGKLTKTADPSQWELTDSGLQLGNLHRIELGMWVTTMWLVQFVGPLAIEPVFSLVHELAFWNPFPMGGDLAQPGNREEGLGPASKDVTDFVDSAWAASPTQRKGQGVGWGMLRGVEVGEEVSGIGM